MTYIPQNPKTYIGNQVILNSDRLIFNAKNDSILLYSDKAIGFSTNGSFHFDTSNEKESKFIINSPNIYLGLDFDNKLPTQSAVLSDDLIIALEDILDAVLKLYSDITFQISYITTSTGAPTSMNPKNYQLLTKREKELELIKDSLQDIKSEITKIA
jgi:hypothetical protein